MPIKISCPECCTEINISEAFPGSHINCPSCNALLILDFQVKQPSTVPIVRPSGPKIIKPEDEKILHNQALKHLSRWIDVPVNDIQKNLELIEQGKAYNVWKIPKGNGPFVREITSPNEDLKKIQRRVLDRLLYRIPVSNAAHGFIPSRSIVTNSRYHLETAKSILNIDLKDAFPSVKRLRVKHILVRYLKIPLKHLGEEVAHEVLNYVIDILSKLVTYNDCLPQGGPCSGYLLNIACIKLDKNIYRLLRNYGENYKYTRYADDITISSSEEIPMDLKAKVEKVIQKCGYQINPRKVEYYSKSRGHVISVTGLILEKNKVRIPAKKMETFRTIIHKASTNKEITEDVKLEVQSIIAFIKMVYGNIPNRIWQPYKIYMENHGIEFPKRKKSYLDLYPS